MEVPSKFKKICEWLEETDDYGDIQLLKNNETGIALLYLCNPAKRNALTGKIMAKFSKLITELENWKEGKAVIVYGSRNFFCSGLNLNLVKQIIDREWHSEQMALLMADNFRRLKNLSLITIALVEGKALGGGAEFSANLDLRIFTEQAQIGFVHKKMGISTAWMGAISLTKLLGPFRAIEILLSSRLISGEEAFQIGLANYVINSTTIRSAGDESKTVTYQINQQTTDIIESTVKQQNELPPPVVDQLETSSKQMDTTKLDELNLCTVDQSSNQNKPVPPQLPVIKTECNMLNENRANYCKKIFKRLKKKDEDKEDKFSKRCKLDVNMCEKLKNDKLVSGKEDKICKVNKQSSKMFRKMRRILFDAEEKYMIKPDIELSSCSEDDELDKVQPPSSDQPLTDSTSSNLIQDGQLNFKVGLSDEDDNTILNLVYNWLAKLTLSLEQDSWKELKQLAREQQSCDSIDLLSHLNHKSFSSHKQACNIDNITDNNWQVLKSINSVANQTV